MDYKFFPRDVIGRKPTKVGDVFKAHFFGHTAKFVVTDFRATMFMAQLVEG